MGLFSCGEGNLYKGRKLINLTTCCIAGFVFIHEYQIGWYSYWILNSLKFTNIKLFDIIHEMNIKLFDIRNMNIKLSDIGLIHEMNTKLFDIHNMNIKLFDIQYEYKTIWYSYREREYQTVWYSTETEG